MKKSVLILLILLGAHQSFAQDEKKDRPFRLEVEPTSYLAKGWSLLASYGVTKDRNLSVGLYTLANDIPSFLNTKIFTNTLEGDDMRLTFEIAATCRYKIPLFKNYESNPYVGLFLGYETFRHQSSGLLPLETKMSNMFLTPQIGYEIYLFRQMVYLNPSFRLIYEFAKKSDYNNPLDASDLGPTILDWIYLPSFSIGVRL